MVGCSLEGCSLEGTSLAQRFGDPAYEFLLGQFIFKADTCLALLSYLRILCWLAESFYPDQHTSSFIVSSCITSSSPARPSHWITPNTSA